MHRRRKGGRMNGWIGDEYMDVYMDVDGRMSGQMRDGWKVGGQRPLAPRLSVYILNISVSFL